MRTAAKAALLAGCCLSTIAHSDRALADTSPASRLAMAQDMGAVPAAQVMRATVWLKKKDQAGFDATVAAIYDRNSPSYQQWMTPGKLASYGANAADLSTVKAQLLAAGLQVVKVAEDGASIQVQGNAASIQRAFGTPIHSFARNGVAFYAATQTPTMLGAAAPLVASITGLTSSQMQPLFLRQKDVTTGAERAALPLASTATDPLNPYLTTKCFGGQAEHSFSGVPGYSSDVTLSGTAMVAEQFDSLLICGYGPADLRAQYGLDAAAKLGLDGSGQTIVIVVAYGSPTIVQDASLYSQVTGLPALDASNFQIVYPGGAPQDTDNDWATETTLDVEMAHAVAPKAKIALVVAPTADDSDLAPALRYAALHRLGNVISNSWGQPEAGADPQVAQAYAQIIAEAAALGINVDVSSGDAGDNGVGSPLGAGSTPADAPYATSVGGTSINIPTAEGVRSLGWGTRSVFLHTPTIIRGSNLLNPSLFENPGAGGGESTIFAKPAYQRQLPGTGRQQPDISADADPNTGVAIVIYDAQHQVEAVQVMGGTSAAAPIVSGIWALANQAAGHRLGQAAPLIARMPEWAITDVLPIKQPGPIITASYNGTAITGNTALSPQALALVPPTTTGFAQFMLATTFYQYSVNYGLDTSLTVQKGWDNVTGYGEPHGIGFITAAALESWRVPLASESASISALGGLMRAAAHQ
jgi:subtilase family serine protease